MMNVHGQARRADYIDRVLALFKEGLPQRLIARRLGLHERTVSRWLKAEGLDPQANRQNAEWVPET